MPSGGFPSSGAASGWRGKRGARQEPSPSPLSPSPLARRSAPEKRRRASGRGRPTAQGEVGGVSPLDFLHSSGQPPGQKSRPRSGQARQQPEESLPSSQKEPASLGCPSGPQRSSSAHAPSEEPAGQPASSLERHPSRRRSSERSPPPDGGCFWPQRLSKTRGGGSEPQSPSWAEGAGQPTRGISSSLERGRCPTRAPGRARRSEAASGRGKASSGEGARRRVREMKGVRRARDAGPTNKSGGGAQKVNATVRTRERDPSLWAGEPGAWLGGSGSVFSALPPSAAATAQSFPREEPARHRSPALCGGLLRSHPPHLAVHHLPASPRGYVFLAGAPPRAVLPTTGCLLLAGCFPAKGGGPSSKGRSLPACPRSLPFRQHRPRGRPPPHHSPPRAPGDSSASAGLGCSGAEARRPRAPGRRGARPAPRPRKADGSVAP